MKASPPFPFQNWFYALTPPHLLPLFSSPQVCSFSMSFTPKRNKLLLQLGLEVDADDDNATNDAGRAALAEFTDDLMVPLTAIHEVLVETGTHFDDKA